MTKVSIIIPIYNQENFINRCLNSILNQTLTDIEIICVNDGSTDSSVSILSTYLKKDKRIKLINQNNSGVSTARNEGVKAAGGEFIGYVDPDDFIEPNFYEYLYNCAIKNNCDIACAGIIKENNKKKKKVLIKYEEQKIEKNIKGKLELAQVPANCYVWNKIYKRESLLKSGVSFRQGIVYEDMIYTPNIILKLGDMVSVPNIYYHYWEHEESLTKNSSDQCRYDNISAKKYIINICNKYHLTTLKHGNLVCKREYFFMGIKILKVYVYKATKKYYLFGLLPIVSMIERV